MIETKLEVVIFADPGEGGFAMACLATEKIKASKIGARLDVQVVTRARPGRKCGL